MKFDKKQIMDILEIGQKVMTMTKKDNEPTSKRSEIVASNSVPVISENMTSDEEDALIQKTKNKLTGRSLKTPAEVCSTLKAFSEAATDAVKFCEVQKTKREEIKAERDVRIARLRVQRDIVMEYLKQSYDERRNLFEEQFKVVDHALMTGNTEVLALSLQSINDLAKSSPFKALADIGNVQRALTQEGSTFDI